MTCFEFKFEFKNFNSKFKQRLKRSIAAKQYQTKCFQCFPENATLKVRSLLLLLLQEQFYQNWMVLSHLKKNKGKH